MSWTIMLEVDSELKPTELAIMVNMFPGVNDCRVEDSQKNNPQTNVYIDPKGLRPTNPGESA
jgi:hypothetical protein